MQVDQRSVDAAVKQALERWPDEEAGAAAAYTADGRVLRSVYVETPNSVVNLCHEPGAICEAHRLNVALVASVCVSREHKDALFLILTPCGVCQERLAHWGGGVQVGVPQPGNPTAWVSRPLREIHRSIGARPSSRFSFIQKLSEEPRAPPLLPPSAR